MPQSTEAAASGSTDDAMTRSEEELRVGTQLRERSRARLRKYVVTEQQQVTVPVRREEAWVEHEPIDETNFDEAVRGRRSGSLSMRSCCTKRRPLLTRRSPLRNGSA